MNNRISNLLMLCLLFGLPVLAYFLYTLDKVWDLGIISEQSPTVECLEGYSRDISSPQEISKYFETPLVGFQNMPNNLDPQPIVTVEVSRDVVSGASKGKCYIKTIYTQKSSGESQIEIRLFTPATVGDFEDKPTSELQCQQEYVPDSGYQSRCNGALRNTKYSAYAIVLTQYPPQIAQTIVGRLGLQSD